MTLSCEDKIEVIERFATQKGRVIAWTQSLDGGRTWEEIKPIGGVYPFVILDYQAGGGYEEEMMSESGHELSIMTNDGWVISILADRPILMSDVVISSVIVQPKGDYDRGLGQRGFGRARRVYRLNVRGEVEYGEER